MENKSKLVKRCDEVIFSKFSSIIQLINNGACTQFVLELIKLMTFKARPCHRCLDPPWAIFQLYVLSWSPSDCPKESPGLNLKVTMLLLSGPFGFGTTSLKMKLVDSVTPFRSPNQSISTYFPLCDATLCCSFHFIHSVLLLKVVIIMILQA